MTDRAPGARQRRAAVLAVVLASLSGLMVGCGVPSSGPPVVLSTVPVNGSNDDPQGTRNQPPAPSSATDPRDLVSLFFTAAGADTTPDQLRQNVSQFFTPGTRRSWRPDPAGMTVVRVASYTVLDQKDGGGPTPTPDTGGNVQARASVQVLGQTVGTLNNVGAVQPLAVGRSDQFDLTLHLVKVDKVWLITDPPSQTLLSTDAVSNEFDATTLYFANPDHTSLVPDLRYVPNSMRPEKRRTVLVDWLLDGPSGWLGPAAVSEIPGNTKRRGNVVGTHNVVVINLTSDAGDAKNPALMAAQLAWTLRPLMNKMQIRIEDRPLSIPGHSGTIYNWNDWRTYNIATLGVGSAGYYIAGGRIVAARSGDQLPGVLADPAADRVDQQVIRAGLSVDASRAALVRASATNRPELWLGRTTGRSNPRVGYTRAKLGTVRSIGRPSFLAGTGTVLAPVDGALVAVSSNGNKIPLDFLENRVSRQVTAVSVAPDGCRIALVAGGRLYVAPLLDSGNGRLTIGRARRLAASFSDISGVAWTEETRVVFGGRGLTGPDGPLSDGPRGGAWELSIDDVYSDLLTGAGDSAVPDQIASSTTDPAKSDSHGTILLAAHDRILQVTGNEVGPPVGAAQPPRGTEPFFPE